MDDNMVGLPARWWSIDPGDLHAAIAKWEGAQCLNTFEFAPHQAIATLAGALEGGYVDVVVYEKFALDRKRMSQQVGSEFLTSQMIGVIKYLCTAHKVPCVGFYNHQHKRIYRMGWYQDLTLKDKRKLPWWGQGTGEHCKDAWCIGMWFKHTRGFGQYGTER